MMSHLTSTHPFSAAAAAAAVQAASGLTSPLSGQLGSHHHLGHHHHHHHHNHGQQQHHLHSNQHGGSNTSAQISGPASGAAGGGGGGGSGGGGGGAASATNSRRDSNSSAMSSSNRSKSNANNKQFLCPHCHRCFTQKGNLKTHMMIHSGEKPYACQICGKSFTQKGNVDTHMKIHTGEKEYNCGSCGKKFTQKGNLKTHVRSVHTKEKPFVCGMCGKSFSQKGNMLTHLRTHNKDDRFPCTLCGKTFSQKGNLKTHMQRHSGQLPARRYGQRRQSSNGSHSHGHSRLMQQGGQSFSAGSSESAKAGKQSMFKNVHEDSGSPAEHSLLTSSHNQAQLHHQISGLGIPVSSEEALNSHHSQGALKLTHVAAFHRDQSMLDSIHSSQNQHLHAAHRSPVSSPVAMQFSQAATVAAAARFYPSNPGMAAPLAHASWLAAASATAAGLSAKGRNPATPYDNFNFGYASFQHPGSHFGRGLTLLNSTIPLTAPDTIQHGRQSNSNTPETSVAVTTSTSQQPGNHSSQSQYSQSTANPDFSQLLE